MYKILKGYYGFPIANKKCYYVKTKTWFGWKVLTTNETAQKLKDSPWFSSSTKWFNDKKEASLYLEGLK